MIKAIPDCSICFANLLPIHPIETLTCGHLYHPDCILNWAISTIKRQIEEFKAYSVPCPLCRENITHIKGRPILHIAHQVFIRYFTKLDPSGNGMKLLQAVEEDNLETVRQTLLSLDFPNRTMMLEIALTLALNKGREEISLFLFGDDSISPEFMVKTLTHLELPDRQQPLIASLSEEELLFLFRYVCANYDRGMIFAILRDPRSIVFPPETFVSALYDAMENNDALLVQALIKTPISLKDILQALYVASPGEIRDIITGEITNRIRRLSSGLCSSITNLFFRQRREE